MNARDAALIQYGGDPPRCAWCGCPDLGTLEIDHIEGGAGQGNRHRAKIKEPLERWLKRHGWPEGFQLLCQRCHREKSEEDRGAMMPGRNGTREIRGYIDEEMAEQFDALAEKSTKTKVLEDAIQALTSGSSRGTGSTGALIKRLEALSEEVQMLRRLVVTMKERQEKQDQELHQIHWASHQAVVQHETWQATLRGCWWYRLVFGRDKSATAP